MIKAVTFDLWNTLIRNKDYTSLRIRRVREFLDRHTPAPNEETIREVYRSVEDRWRSDPARDYRFMPVKERVDLLLRKLRVQVDQELKITVVRYFEEVLLEDPPILYEGAKLTLESLYGKYLIGLISDSGFTPGRILRSALEFRGILKFFRCTVFSDEVGYNKPNPIIFNRALELLEVHPKETIHIGDLPETDIAGAKRVKMLTVRINREQKVASGEYPRPDYQINELCDLMPLLGI